jgi:serpin B
VDVNEEGTEAAAATATAMARSIGGPFTPTFRADRPFVFLIRDGKTGTVLFVGRVTDPR